MKATATLLLAACVLWLLFDRVIVRQRSAVADHAAEARAGQATAVPQPTVAEIAAAFPQERLEALLAAASPVPAAPETGSIAETATLVQNSLDPARMFRRAPLAVTADKVLGNDWLNPRRVRISPEVRTRLDQLVELYQEHVRMAYQAEGAERQQQMMARIARNALPTAAALEAELTAEDHAMIAARLQAIPAQSAEDREQRHQGLLRDAVTKRFQPDAITAFPDGTVYIAKRGELAEALGSYLQYREFLVGSFYTNIIALLTPIVGLQSHEVEALLLEYERSR